MDRYFVVLGAGLVGVLVGYVLCRGLRRERKADEPEDDENHPYKEEAMPELRDALRSMLDDEQDRENSLNARASSLTGFLAVIVSVAAVAGVGVSGDDASEYETWLAYLVGGTLTGAIAILVLAVVLVVVKVLRPQSGLVVDPEEAATFHKPPFSLYTPAQIQGYLVRAYSQSLTADSERNGGKAKWLKVSYWLVCLALVLVATAGVGATINRYVGDAARDPPSEEQQQSGHERADGDAEDGAGKTADPSTDDAADQRAG